MKCMTCKHRFCPFRGVMQTNCFGNGLCGLPCKNGVCSCKCVIRQEYLGGVLLACGQSSPDQCKNYERKSKKLRPSEILIGIGTRLRLVAKPTKQWYCEYCEKEIKGQTYYFSKIRDGMFDLQGYYLCPDCAKMLYDREVAILENRKKANSTV